MSGRGERERPRHEFRRTFTFSSARNNQQNTIVTVVEWSSDEKEDVQ